MRTTVVIPHHLPTLDFLNEWRTEFQNPNVNIIIVEDKPERVTTVPDWLNNNGKVCLIYTHKDIDNELGKNSWIIPRGTSAIRSYGLYKAWQQKPDMIITLDNDCFPDNPSSSYFINGHWKALKSPITLNWSKSTPDGFLPIDMVTRGFPYGIRGKTETYVSHGLWSKIPDLDAAQMLLLPDLRTQPADRSFPIPRWNFYPMCGMNLAFRPEVTPLMYFGLFGKKYGFDQFDDIWAGVFSKKVMDHLGWGVRSGYPSVEHRKQSDAFVNFKKQAGGLAWNEEIWQLAADAIVTADNPIECYNELIEDLEWTELFKNTPYFKKVAKATKIWLKLFK